MVRHILVELSEQEFNKAKALKGPNTWKSLILGEKDQPEQISKAIKDYIEDFIEMKIENFERRLKA